MNAQNEMHLGRAQHMDLARASDADLDAAFRALDAYQNSGQASAMTTDKFDDRIADIFDEQDRRAGIEPVYVRRLPLSFWHPPVEAAGDDDAEQPEQPVTSPDPHDALTGVGLDGLVPGETSDI